MRLGGVAEVVRGAGGGREREMGEGGTSASNGAPCRDAGDGERGGGGGEVTGCYRGHRLGTAGKGAFPPSVDMQCLSPVMHKAVGVSGRFHWDYSFQNLSFQDRQLIQFLRCFFCFFWLLNLLWDKDEAAVGGEPILSSCRVEIIHIIRWPCKINWFEKEHFMSPGIGQ